MRYGFYPTAAHGRVQRYRCRTCGSTCSTQSESLHYFAKRRLPLEAVWQLLLAGASQREIARRYRFSPMAVQAAVQRLGRQAMAAQLELLPVLRPRPRVVFDGLRSSICGQDYPCDITTVVEPGGETILTIEHTIFRRGGRMTPAQRRRRALRYARWRPAPGTMYADISRVVGELWDYLRPPETADSAHRGRAATVDTDEHPLYAAALARSAVGTHLRGASLLRHITTPSTAPRSAANRLFAVNYVDRLLRHRLREHTRESFAIGRHASVQMHRAWIFAWDHNCRRPWRVRRPQAGVHAAREAVPAAAVRRLTAGFFRRRIRPEGEAGVPETIRRVWMCELPTPPIRWRTGQRGTTVTVPAFARRDLAGAYQQGP
jgi:hypothetical protein